MCEAVNSSHPVLSSGCLLLYDFVVRAVSSTFLVNLVRCLNNLGYIDKCINYFNNTQTKAVFINMGIEMYICGN